MKSKYLLNLLLTLSLIAGALSTSVWAQPLEPATVTTAPLLQEPVPQAKAAPETPTQPQAALKADAGSKPDGRAEQDAAYAPCDAGPMAAWPGPDGFGYIGATATYDWVDIAASGTQVLLGDDDHDGPFSIGFTFGFYGSAYTDFYIQSNGAINFVDAYVTLVNQCPLPDAGTPDNLIALMWDDLDPGDNGDPVYYESFAAGTCPYGSYTGACLVVQYEDFCHYPGGATCITAGTFEAILFDDGSVVVQFEDAGGEEGSGSTTGIEGGDAVADHGLTYACDTAVSLSDGLAIMFVTPNQPVFDGNKMAPAMAMPGDVLTYNIVFQNIGPVSATNASLVDPIPNGTTFAYVVEPPALTYNPGMNQVEWTGTVTNGATITATFAVTVEDDAPCGVAITNTATLTDPAALAALDLQAVTSVWDLFTFATDLEAEDGGFTALQGEWEWGAPTYPAGISAHSGVNVWGTDLDNDADDTIEDHILSRMINVPPFPDVPIVLTWWDWNGAEAADYIRVYVDDTLVYEQYDYDQREWVMHSVDLTPWRGQTVELQFDLNVCCANPGPDGWYIDDIAIATCQPAPDLYLSPDTLEASGCNGITQTHNLYLANWTGAGGTFNLTYDLADPAYGSIEGPPTLALADEASASFTVTLTPEVCLPNGFELSAAVEASGNGYTDTSYITKTISALGSWEFQDGMLTARGDLAVVYGGEGGLYAIGGTVSGGTANGENERYDVAADSWSSMAAMPTGVTIIDGGQVDGTIYVPGGYDNTSFLTTTWAYSTTANSWTTVAAAPRAVAGYAVATCDGLLYRAGGTTLAAWPNGETALEVYNPATDAWTSLSSMAHGHTWPSMACIDGKLYLAGGIDETGADTTVAEVYDIATDTWSDGDMADLPATWWGAGDFAKHDQLYMAGGIEGGSSSANIVVYDPATDAWSYEAPLQDARFRLEGDFAVDSGYAVGGWDPLWTPHDSNEYLVQCPVCTERGWLEGYVYDYDDASLPCTDATVHIEPGDVDLSVDASGYYTVELVAFDYDVSASAVDYPEPDGPYVVTVSDGAVTPQDFALDRPDVSVDPTALSASAIAPNSVTRYFTITNSGTYALEYLIREFSDSPLAAVAEPGAYQQSPAAVGVDPLIYEDFAASPDGRADFFIAFGDTADLTLAYSMNWSDRGRFVVAALQAAADKSQSQVQAWLTGRGIAYTSYWINNTILIHADQATLNELAAFPAVSGFRNNRPYQVFPVEVLEESPAAPLAPAYPWNVTFPMADQVHTGFGVRGEGVVIGGMDTGVDYDHIGLVQNYRGCLDPPACTSFDHTYSWYDPSNSCGGTPCDTDTHGTSTMGIMAGDDDPSLPDGAWIGMAPNAQWIHCLGCPSGGCPPSDTTSCAQWFLAPGGNSDMRPHVVNHSWGSWSPDDCDGNSFATELEAYRAADILPAFAAGNVGDWVTPYNCWASTSPANNTDAAGNPLAFASGAHGSDGVLHDYSSGGPSACNNDNLFPDVAAPGSGSCTTGLNDTYNCSFGGTSSASPHTAGCAALLRSANPFLTVDEVEQAIRDAANDVDDQCGTPAESADWNNKYGEGHLDCYEAVDLVFAPDVPWVDTDIVSGTLAPGDQVVEVTFTCTPTASQQAQPLQGSLRVQHNDPCADPLDVDLTFSCFSANPFPTWEKALWINDVEATPLAGPHTVRPGDTVVIVDYVGASFSETITAVLEETWSDSLALVDYDTDGVGSVTAGANQLLWNLTGVAPNVLYPITKTFEVQYGDWVTDYITESYTVEDALVQPEDIVVVFERYVPELTLDKSGVDAVEDGDVISLTLVISSDGTFRGDAVLTDVLPLGMTYAGNLTYTYGRAWEAGNVIYWTSYTTTTSVLAPTAGEEVLILTPDVGSGGGDVSSLVAALDTCGVTITIWDPDADGDPSVADLLAYDVVVLGNDVLWNNMDKTTVGNNLADYIDQGGKVIEGLYVQSFDSWGFAGRYMTDGYSPFTPATLDNWNPDTMNVVDPAHPIMYGVSSVGDNWGHQDPALSASADLIADWTTSGYNYVAANVDVVALNQLLHHQAAWTGDVPLILCNSIAYLAASAAPPMSATVTVTFDVQVTGNTGEIIRNIAELDWGTDYTSDAHDVEIIVTEYPIYMPILFKQ